MQAYSRNELLEAERQIKSLLIKLYKVEPKLKPGSSQHSLLTNRVRALEIALSLIDQKLLSLERH